MKKILITGANSYIGTAFENYILQFPNDYSVSVIDTIGGEWRNSDFSEYDVIYHVAGIAHSDSGKISEEREKLYYEVNTKLAVDVARKAKDEGVKQFIFMSSIIVYGNSAKIGKNKVVTKDTPLSPANCYGNSKVLAEKGILELQTNDFRVVILRPPMIYGKGSKGNYPTLSKFAKKLPLFPYVKNQRSMLYVGNLVEFVRLVIKNEESGVFFPQNDQYTNTSLMVKEIGKVHGKKIRLVKGFGWLLRFVGLFSGVVNKAFGNLCYAKEMSEYKENYIRKTYLESINETES